MTEMLSNLCSLRVFPWFVAISEATQTFLSKFLRLFYRVHCSVEVERILRQPWIFWNLQVCSIFSATHQAYQETLVDSEYWHIKENFKIFKCSILRVFFKLLIFLGYSYLQEALIFSALKVCSNFGCLFNWFSASFFKSNSIFLEYVFKNFQ